MSATVALVAAVAENGVIGRDNDMPWRLPSDLKRFKALTMGHPIVMGRKTFQSIGKALPGRHNIVVTRDTAFSAPGVEVVDGIDTALEAARRAASETGTGEIMVIGGATIYEQTIGRAKRLYITRVLAAPDGDTRFPAIDPELWRCVDEQPGKRGPKDSADTVFAVYERIFRA